MEEDSGYPPVATRWNVNSSDHSYASAVFEAIVASDRLKVHVNQILPQVRKALSPESLPCVCALWVEDEDSRTIVGRWRGGAEVVLIKEIDGVAQVRVAGSGLTDVRKTVAEICDLLPEESIRRKMSLPVTFWSFGDSSVEASVRELELVSWCDIARNYPRHTQETLENLMDRSQPEKNEGRLLLWHGEPGTGKTFAIRALAWAWKDWCDFHYVIDPEKLFGNGNHLWDFMLDRVFSPCHVPTSSSRWRTLIIEDSGELIALDAKTQTGQALSRLLNLSDGILGQGTKILVLITTNEEIGKLSPAISRPGRCLSEVAFHRFQCDEAASWLRIAGFEAQIDGARTLSELYAIRAGRRLTAESKPIGFCS